MRRKPKNYPKMTQGIENNYTIELWTNISILG
jgi:hypothetical protein